MSGIQSQAAALMAEIENQYGASPEFLWRRNPDYAVFRRTDNRKWFAVFLPGTPRERLGLPGGGTVDIVDLKCDPKLQGSLLDGRRYLPGYHMNKEHWLTVLLDGSVSMEELGALAAVSYDLAAGRRK